MTDDWEMTRLGDVTRQTQDTEQVKGGNEYRLLGVRWYAEGPFLRETVTRETSKATRIFRVSEGQFIYNRMFAWKGAFGVVPAALDGCFVSNEFPLFECDREVLLADYLGLWFQQPRVWDEVGGVSTGTTASRNRWKESQFEDYSVNLPPIPVQRRIVDLMAHLDHHLANLRAERDGAKHLLDTARVSLTAAWEPAPLAEICAIRARLVDPRASEYRNLLHIGIERMEKDGGALSELLTAGAEGLISSKYLFDEQDVVLSKIRPNLRKVVHPNFVGLCSADAYPLRPVDGLPPALLRELLLLPSVTEALVSKSGRTKMPKVNRAELFQVSVPFSQDHYELVQVAEMLTGMRDAVVALDSELRRLAAVRSALLPRLLDGSLAVASDYDLLLPEVA